MWGLAGVCVAPESSRGQHLLWTSGQGLMTAMHLGKCYRNLPPVPGKPWPCESADPGPGAQPDEAVTGEKAGMRATPPNGRAQGENACPLCFPLTGTHGVPFGCSGGDISLEMRCHRGQNQPTAELRPLPETEPDPDPTSPAVAARKGLQGWRAWSPAFFQDGGTSPYL